MSIRTLRQLRETAPADLQALDDRNLVEAYSARVGVPFEEAATYFGLPESGLLSEMGNQLAAGIRVDLPRMAGAAAQFVARETGNEGGALDQMGQGLRTRADAREETFQPDYRGRNWGGKALVMGARAAPATLAAVAPAVIAAPIAGPTAGVIAASTGSAVLFGGSGGQESYERVLDETGDEQAAAAAGRASFAVQGLGEAAATAVGARVVMPLARALKGAPNMAAVANRFTNPRVYKDFGRALALNYPVQMSTEVAQDVGASYIEQYYGASPEDIGQIATDSAQAAFGLTTLLGGFGLGAATVRARNADRLRAAIENDPGISPEERQAALLTVQQMAVSQGVPEAEATQWVMAELQKEQVNTEALAQLEQSASAGIAAINAVEAARRGSDAAAAADAEQGAQQARASFIAAGSQTMPGTEMWDESIGAYREMTVAEFAAIQSGVIRDPNTPAADDVEVDLTESTPTTVEDIYDKVLELETARDQTADTVAQGENEIDMTTPPVAEPVAEQPVPVQPVPVEPVVDQPVAETPPPTALTAEQWAEESKDNVEPDIASIIKNENAIAAEIKKADTPQTLQAEATSGAVPRSEGRPSFIPQIYRAITEAILSDNNRAPVRMPKLASIDMEATAQYGDGIARVAAAIDRLTTAYRTYLDKGGAAARTNVKFGNKIDAPDKDAKAVAVANTRVQSLDEAGLQVQDALQGVREAVRAMGGNDRDIDVLVGASKSRIHGKGRAKRYAKAEQRLRSNDAMFSQAWLAMREGALGEQRVDRQYVRSGDTRDSLESIDRQQAIAAAVPGAITTTPLEDAVTDGYNKFGNAAKDTDGNPRPAPTGVFGMLNRLITHGTPYERTLATGVAAVFDKMGQAGVLPSVEFITEGNPNYDPATNTISLTKDASPEVQLHESLHAALQWYVYNNRESKEVTELLSIVKRVADYTGDTPLTGRAAHVQQLLADLLNKGQDLDAVLELVSYGNTLNEFRRALEQLEGTKAPRTFLQGVNDIWKGLVALVRRMLNAPQSLAGDVLMNTVSLLNKAAMADVLSVKLVPNAAQLTAAVTSNATTQQVSNMTPANYKGFMARPAKPLVSTQHLFDMIGWEKASAKITEAASTFAKFIRKEMPTAERMLALFNSRFSVPDAASYIMDSFKHWRHTPYQWAELMANYIERADVPGRVAVAAYLDGDKKALDSHPDAARLKMAADQILNHFKEAVAYLPSVQRDYFLNNKFTEVLIYPESTKNVAPHSLTYGGVGTLMSFKVRMEPDITGSKAWMKLGPNGEPNVGDKFVQVLGPDLTSPNKPMIPQGFMSQELYVANGNRAPNGYAVDSSRVWSLDRKDKSGYKFVSTVSRADAIKDQNATRFANALRNTMAALAANASSKRFMFSMYTLGRVGVAKNADPDANAVAFDDAEQIKRVLGINVDKDKIFDASTDEAGNPTVRNVYRASYTWVRLPTGAGYGPMAGKLVEGPIWTAMIDMNDRQPFVTYRSYQQALTFFKKTKTTLNFGTHLTNTLTNFTLMSMHDITFKQLRDASRIYVNFERNLPGSADKLTQAERNLMRDFINSGAMLGNFSDAEIKQAIYESLLKTGDPRADQTPMSRMVAWTNYEQSKAKLLLDGAGKRVKNADEIMGQLYNAEDNVFRFAAFLKRASELQSLNNEAVASEDTIRSAGIFARQAFVDYDIDAKAIRVLRQTIMPFVSWTYGIAPVLGRVALHKPWKIANILAAYQMAAVGLAALAGEEDDDRDLGPEYVRDRMFGIGPYTHIRLPLGDSENPVYYRMGDYFPMAGAHNGMPNGFMGQSWWPQVIQPGNPIITTILAAFGGVDAYTGKSIHEDTDDNLQRLFNIAQNVWNTYTPPTVSTMNINNARKILDESVGPTGEKTSPAVFARILGLRVYQYNEHENAAFEEFAVDGIRRQYQTAMARAKREEYQKGYPDYEALDKELQRLTERMEKEIAKARNEPLN